MESVPDPIDSLLSCSGSPYVDVLPGPPQTQSSGKGALSILTGWEKARPSAVYDLTAAVCQEPIARRHKKQSNNKAFLRDTVSMPNLCTSSDPVREAQKCPYMSGYVDEDFSYVYTGGLSERSRKANPVAAECKKLPHGHDSQRTSVSTCNLTLDPASLFNGRHSAYSGPPRTQYGEISTNMFAAQLKPELLAQQLLIESRLRNVDLNARPGLQKDNVNGSSGREKRDMEGTNAASLAHAKSAHLQKTRKLRRQRQTQPKMWHPLPASEESHQQLPVDLLVNPGSQGNSRIPTNYKHPKNDVAINSKTRSYNQFEFDSFHRVGIPGRKMTRVRLPRSGEESKKSKDLKEGKKTAVYHIIYDHGTQTRDQESSLNLPTAIASQTQAWREDSQAIPVFIPSRALEWEEAATIPNRFSRSKLRVQSRSPSNMFKRELVFYAE